MQPQRLQNWGQVLQVQSQFRWIGLPLPTRAKPADQTDQLEGCEIKIPQIDAIIKVFRDANARGLSSSDFLAYVANNLLLGTSISAEVQWESYLYHTAYKAIKAVRISCFPQRMGHNSMIAYGVIATIWPTHRPTLFDDTTL